MSKRTTKTFRYPTPAAKALATDPQFRPKKVRGKRDKARNRNSKAAKRQLEEYFD